MAITNFPNGVSSFGIPLMGSGPFIPPTTGAIFFVHSGTGNNGHSGKSPDQPLATIDAAVNKCTANKGDQIIVMPGHAENISSATSLVLDVAGILVVGLGWGRLRPTLSFTNAAGRIPISAANVVVDNLVFLGAVADVVSGITITGNDVILRNCEMASGGAALEFLQFLDIDAASRVRVQNCRIIASATAGTNTGIRIDATDDLVIEGCELRGDFTTAAISGNTGTGAASTNARLTDNVIENVDDTAGLLLDHHDNTTGVTSNNKGFTAYVTNITAPFDPGNTRNIDNKVVNLVDETGALSPTTAST